MTLPKHYDKFAAVIASGPATPCGDTITMVMKLSGGNASPCDITTWWNQWQLLRATIKAQHPMVKLAAELAPGNPIDPAAAHRALMDKHLPLLPPAAVPEPCDWGISESMVFGNGFVSGVEVMVAIAQVACRFKDIAPEFNAQLRKRQVEVRVMIAPHDPLPDA